ncbi:MAG: HAD-IC family P-type ATPase, partial [Acidimicrobiales bacterium]
MRDISITADGPAVGIETGLTTLEAERRHQAGQGNTTDDRTTRSVTSILRANILTRFNAIVSSLVAVVLVFGDPIDAIFGFVMVLNSLVGTVQEIRAKRSLDALQVLLTPTIGVVRDGELCNLAPEHLVLGDLLSLTPGDQIPVDGDVLISEGLEVDESALTGESEPVTKGVGSEILSGSYVVAGAGRARASRVGEESWVNQLTAEAKDFVLSESELRAGIDRLLRVISWILPPLAALLVWSQQESASTLGDGLVWAVSGVVALVPQGLVLLVSMAMAVAVIRLGKSKVVVQELPAVEGLARVDVLCVDKTGTLTTGNLAVDRLIPIEVNESEVRDGLAALFQLDAARSATADAIRAWLAMDPPKWQVDHVVPFSSVRKWSGGDFGEHGSWILGAPEILLESANGTVRAEVALTVDELTRKARRVLLVAQASTGLSEEVLPQALTPVGLVSLKEEVRSDAAETMDYFAQQNVGIRVISGDNPQTVAAVAAEVGIPGADRFVDMRTIDSLDSIPEDTAVFGRVLPEQKRDLVRMLQSRGYTVAMTGDGVNDIPSLKAADTGIAMNTATPATKATAQLVLLDGRFDRLPSVVGEGRRVIANMERVSSLFITKTVYATILAVSVGVAVMPFPFLPRHLSLISELTIGIPAFALSFRPNDQPCRPGYLARVLEFSVPAGVVAAAATLITFWAAQTKLIGATLEQARTGATITLALIGMWIIYRLARPLDRREIGLLTALVLLLGITIAPGPVSEFYALSLPPGRTSAVIVAVLLAAIALLDVGIRMCKGR